MQPRGHPRVIGAHASLALRSSRCAAPAARPPAWVQDIEGVFSKGEYYVVQSRPQIVKKH